MPKFVWTNDDCDGAEIIDVPDEETAYRVAIAHRLASGQTLEEAVRWFRKSDRLIEIVGAIVDAPYEGDLPDPDDADE